MKASGDPTLIWPGGLEVTPLYPKGRPREPCEIAVRGWISLRRRQQPSPFG
jgi:hypothetical protein